jgi:hypothetical protein
MLAILLTIQLTGAVPQPVPVAWTGRVVTLPWLHLGVRPHVYVDGVETAGAITIQARF